MRQWDHFVQQKEERRFFLVKVLQLKTNKPWTGVCLPHRSYILYIYIICDVYTIISINYIIIKKIFYYNAYSIEFQSILLLITVHFRINFTTGKIASNNIPLPLPVQIDHTRSSYSLIDTFTDFSLGHIIYNLNTSLSCVHTHQTLWHTSSTVSLDWTSLPL